jgi:hypothetical protein
MLKMSELPFSDQLSDKELLIFVCNNHDFSPISFFGYFTHKGKRFGNSSYVVALEKVSSMEAVDEKYRAELLEKLSD